jgi:hypothetical protein
MLAKFVRRARPAALQVLPAHVRLQPLSYVVLQRTFATRAQQAAARAAASAPFEPLVSALYDKIEKALEDMRQLNEGMTVEREGLTLRIYTGPGSGASTGHKTFTFTVDDPASRTLTYSTPAKANATIHYKYKAETGQWLGAEDGHYLEDLFTREILLYCKGMPYF